MRNPATALWLKVTRLLEFEDKKKVVCGGFWCLVYTISLPTFPAARLPNKAHLQSNKNKRYILATTGGRDAADGPTGKASLVQASFKQNQDDAPRCLRCWALATAAHIERIPLRGAAACCYWPEGSSTERAGSSRRKNCKWSFRDRLLSCSLQDHSLSPKFRCCQHDIRHASTIRAPSSARFWLQMRAHKQ